MHDYSSAGWYFITICTPWRRPYFGRMARGEIRRNVSGQIVTECWSALPDHFPDILIDAFVVMPDHVHGIVVIRSSTGRITPGQSAVIPGSLAAVVRSFKSAATRQIRMLEPNHPPVWQRNYYERILRDEDAVRSVRRYIVNNPAKLARRVARGW